MSEKFLTNLQTKLKVLEHKLADSSAYDRYAQSMLESALAAAQLAIERQPTPTNKNALTRALSHLERHAHEAHGASNLSDYETKFRQWKNEADKKLL